MHYSSQTAAPSRGFPDFVLRAPAAAGADRPSSSSVSDEEEEGEVAPAIQQAPPTHPLPPDSRDDNARLREGAAAPPGGCCFLGVGGCKMASHVCLAFNSSSRLQLQTAGKKETMDRMACRSGDRPMNGSCRDDNRFSRINPSIIGPSSRLLTRRRPKARRARATRAASASKRGRRRASIAWPPCAADIFLGSPASGDG